LDGFLIVAALLRTVMVTIFDIRLTATHVDGGITWIRFCHYASVSRIA